MNGLCMPSHTEQLGMTNPFHECTCNKETRQGQTGRVHELDGSWHKNTHWSTPSSRVWRETRTLKLHCSSAVRIHLWKHWQNTLKLSLQLLHIQMMKYSGNQFILLTQVVESVLILLPNNADVSVTMCHRISVSFFNIKLTIANQKFKNKSFICKNIWPYYGFTLTINVLHW